MKRGSPTGEGEHAIGYRKPPRANQFVKGQSGNPSGRPKGKSKSARPSSFAIILDRTLTIERDGRAREVTVEEALQHKLLQDALAGDRSAERQVMKMIMRREKARAAMSPPPSPPQLLIESDDPDNANEALVILGIAQASQLDGHPRLKLLPWAVQAALDRRRRPNLEP